MRKSIILVLCLFAWIIFLKKDAQVGIFKDTPKIEVSSGFFSRTDNKAARLVFFYKGRHISLPFSSIAYWTKGKEAD